MRHPGTHICIATLGGQPQVITLTLDLLLARGLPISEVIVVHLSTNNPRYRQALHHVAAEFNGDMYQGRPCRYRPQPLMLGNAPVDDLHDDMAVDAVVNCFHYLLQECKCSDAIVHLCLAGGRRLLGMLALAAAQFHFTPTDRIWHLHSSDAVRHSSQGGAEMHLPNHPDVRLVRMPLQPWAFYMHPLPLPPEADAATVRTLQTHALDSDEQRRCRSVYQRLTPRQRDVLRLLAEDRTPQEIAEQLQISLATVNSHKTAIAQECLAAWGLAPETRIAYDWLRRRFATFTEW